jgi:hypothetical protein
LWGWRRVRGKLRAIRKMDGWVSPHLGIRFDVSCAQLVIWGRNGQRFLTFNELMQQKAEAEKQKEEAERRATEAEERARRLAERIRALGIDPEA